MQKTAEQIEKDLLRPIFTSSVKYKVAVALSACLVLAGVSAFGYQLYAGIGVCSHNKDVTERATFSHVELAPLTPPASPATRARSARWSADRPPTRRAS